MSETSVKLTADSSEFRSTLEKAAADGGTFATKLADKVGDKLYGMRDISTAVATALGLNIQNIADNVARYFAGLTKEQEAAFKSVEDMTEKSAAINKANARERLSDGQKLQQLLNEEATARRQLNEKQEEAITISQQADKQQKILMENMRLIQDGESSAVGVAASRILMEKEQATAAAKNLKERGELEITINQLGAEIDKARRDRAKELGDIAKKNYEAEQSANEKKRDAMAKELSDEQRINLLSGEKVLLHEAIIAKKKEGVDHTKETARLAAITKDLAEIEKEDKTQSAKIAKEIGLTSEDELYRARLKKKAYEDLTDEERAHLELIKAKVDLQTVLGKIKDLELKLIKGEIIPSEEVRLAEMEKQRDELIRQITLISEVESGVKGVLMAETEVTEEIKKQNEERKFSGVSGTPELSGRSTASIEGLVRSYTAQLSQVGGPYNMQIGDYNSQQDFGTWSAAQAIRVNREAAQAVLNRRKEIQTYSSNFGENAARGKYGDSYYNEAMREMVSVATNTLNTLNTISGQLTSAGLAPGVMYGSYYNSSGSITTGYYKNGPANAAGAVGHIPVAGPNG